MPRATVDSGVLIGMADTQDRHHDAAMAIVSEMDHGNLPIGHVTDYVLLETLNWIHERKRHQIAVDTHQRLERSAGFEIDQAARKDFARGIELFDTHDGLSFGDATTAAYMEREGIEYCYAFDDDFDDVEHVTRLQTPDDPFA
jgi:predicted nucleic acid-binding protein